MMAGSVPLTGTRIASLFRQTTALRPIQGVPCRAFSEHPVTSSERAIILYTKEECPLCDGLKDKIQAILDRAPFTGSALQGYRLEPRDIKSNSEWEKRYAMEVPVVAIIGSDGSERVVPRQSPRATADRLEQVICKSMKQ